MIGHDENEMPSLLLAAAEKRKVRHKGGIESTAPRISI